MDVAFTGRFDYSSLSESNSNTVLEACFFQSGDLKLASQPVAPSPFPYKGKYPFRFKVPIQPGKYDLLLSIRTIPFPGSRNSKTIEFTVK
jgi:hypothetical protein